jgi:hypothetical protein
MVVDPPIAKILFLPKISMRALHSKTPTLARALLIRRVMQRERRRY